MNPKACRKSRAVIALAAAVAGVGSSARGLVINPTFDSSIVSLSDADEFESAINYVDDQLGEEFSNPITVNITFKGTTAPGIFAETFPNENSISYSTLRNAFLTDAANNGNADQMTAAANDWPSSDPTGGNGWAVGSAEEKALGLLSANASGLDATVIFDVSPSAIYTFDPLNRAAPGAADFIGVMEHEITHGLGRFVLAGTPGGNSSRAYAPLDLYRFTAPGVRGKTAVNGVYYSIDGGHSDLRVFDNASDAADWDSNGPTGAFVADSFDASDPPGVEIGLTPIDITTMDGLGFNPYSTALTWSGGSGDFFNGGHWFSPAQSVLNPHHGANLMLNSGAASHLFTAGENLILASDADIGTSLNVQNASLQVSGFGTPTANSYGVLVGQDGQLTANTGAVINIAGSLNIGYLPDVTNATATFASTSTVNVGTTGGATQIFYVGGRGVGAVTQLPGAIVNTPTLEVGYATVAVGTYTLSGTAKVNVSTAEIIGDFGIGSINQSGGTNTVGASASFILGNNPDSTGNYTLSNDFKDTGVLVGPSSGVEYIGYYGTGTFTQTGGNNSTEMLVLGSQAGSGGTYTLNGAASKTNPVRLNVSDSEILGDAGSGVISQSGAVNNVSLASALILGFSPGGFGEYLLGGGTLSGPTSGFELIGEEGKGTFDQFGGSNTAEGIVIGNDEGSMGTYLLSSSGTLHGTSSETVGQNGAGTFTQSGGSNSTPVLTIGDQPTASGTYTLSGGTLSVGSATIGGNGGTAIRGTLTVSSTGALSCTGLLTIKNTGVLNISGGSANIAALAGAGAMNISGGVTTLALDGGMSQVGGMSVTGGGVLDITDNALAIDYAGSPDPAAAIAAAIRGGYNNGTWTGTGITSSTAAANPTQFAVGYLDGNNPADLVGGTVAPNQIIIMYTIAGDAFLQGSVGFDDLVVLAQNFGLTGKDWSGGNFNNDPAGSVGFADLVNIAQYFGQSTFATGGAAIYISPAWQVAEVANTPEPTVGLTLVAMGGVLLRRRCRIATLD